MSLNSSSNYSDNFFALINCQFLPVSSLINTYLNLIISLIGLATNLFTSIVFSQMVYSVKLESHMFKYLLLKSINDTFQFFFHVFSPLFYCGECEPSYAGLLWFIAFYQFAEGVVEFSSSWMEVFATLDFYSLVTNKLKFIATKKFFWIVVFIFHVYPILFHIPIFYMAQVQTNVDAFLRVTYSIYMTPFYFSDAHKILEGILNTQLHLAVLVALVFLSFLIMFELVKSHRRKNKLVGNNKKMVQNKSKSLAEKALKNQRQLIIFLNLNYFIGHIFKFVWSLSLINLPTDFEMINFWNCFNIFSLLLLYISYMPNAFIFYKFNKHFKMYTKQNFKYLTKKILFFKK
jgi:hypothetical protein